MRTAYIIVAALTFVSEVASAQILNPSNIDDLCRTAALSSRKTIIYVDLASVKPSEPEWGLTLLNKLELGAREPLSILAVNPDSYEITEVFNGCYPTFTTNEIQETRKNRSAIDNLIKADPEVQQKENVQTFESRLRGALSKVVDLNGKAKFGARRNVLGGISVDKNRFRDARSFYRMVIFTDGALSDPGLAEDKLAQSLVEKYPAFFSGAEVFVYGVRADRERSIETKEKAFSGYFLANSGWVRSFSSSLPKQTADELQPASIFKGTFEGGGGKGAATVSFNLTKSGAIEQGWVTFLAGTSSYFVPMKGEYTCADKDCKLNAVALENVPYWSPSPFFRKNDRISLTGNVGGELQGAVAPANKEVFKGGNTEAQYSLRVKSE